MKIQPISELTKEMREYRKQLALKKYIKVCNDKNNTDEKLKAAKEYRDACKAVDIEV